ncbi:hypothetical protein G9C98_007915 [Cotesia typhae]|uniref:Uncharacterized protein n=1 Tax=Cotesia typhae TaxID=2053667 RepID=A0A8J5R9G3_9HYME|nr:hypothetical protein G9C98_007915 [Cotesia typhae]
MGSIRPFSETLFLLFYANIFEKTVTIMESAAPIIVKTWESSPNALTEIKFNESIQNVKNCHADRFDRRLGHCYDQCSGSAPLMVNAVPTFAKIWDSSPNALIQPKFNGKLFVKMKMNAAARNANSKDTQHFAKNNDYLSD